MKISFAIFLLGYFIFVAGCGQNSSKSIAPVPDTPNDELAVHKMDECPANIEGTFEGKSDSGKKLTAEFFRNSEGTLTYGFTLEGDEENSVMFPVNGKKQVVTEKSYLSFGCSNSTIISVSKLNGQLSKAEIQLSGDGLKMTSIVPGASTRLFSRIKISLKIINASIVKQMVADSTDNPNNYAKGGQLIPRASAVDEVVAKKETLCMVRTRLYDPKDDDEFSITSNRAEQQSGGLNYRTLAYTDDLTGSAFAVVCVNGTSRVTIQAMKTALKGIIDVLPENKSL